MLVSSALGPTELWRPWASWQPCQSLLHILIWTMRPGVGDCSEKQDQVPVRLSPRTGLWVLRTPLGQRATKASEKPTWGQHLRMGLNSFLGRGLGGRHEASWRRMGGKVSRGLAFSTFSSCSLAPVHSAGLPLGGEHSGCRAFLGAAGPWQVDHAHLLAFSPQG